MGSGSDVGKEEVSCQSDMGRRWIHCEDGFTVEIDGGETVVLNTDWTVGEPMMLADIGGKEVTVQVGGRGWGGGVASLITHNIRP